MVSIHCSLFVSVQCCVIVALLHILFRFVLHYKIIVVGRILGNGVSHYNPYKSIRKRTESICSNAHKAMFRTTGERKNKHGQISR